MRVRCGVYGEGSVFSVEIEGTAEVEALQEAIVNEMKDVNDRFNVDPALVTLYLARKKEGENGKWLKHDRTVKGLLQGGINAEYEEMFSSWKLDDDELFGEEFQPGDKEIHVLVELPESVAGFASEKSAPTKRKNYSHSQVGKSSSKGRELLQDLNIQVEPVDAVLFATGDPTPVQAFKWESISDGGGQNIPLYEEQQRERYRLYVEHNIGAVLAEKKVCVLGVEKRGNILSAAVPGYEIDLKGRADLLVLNALVKQHPSYLEFLPGVRMVIEVGTRCYHRKYALFCV